jgi:ABC-2 type transport system permease protein
VNLAVITWFELTALLWVTALPFAVLGIFIGFMVNAKAAFPVVTALMFVLGYFGGRCNPVGTMPHGLQVAARVLPSFHHAALGRALLDGQGFGVEHWLCWPATPERSASPSS